MGCNCKRKPQVMNNVDNVDVINYAKEIYDRVISQRTLEEYTDVDKVEIMGSYSSLYPASSITPSLEEAINQIKIGINLYEVRKRR